MASKPRLYIRKFLNRPGHHAIASILVKVGRNGVTCDISDCNRVVKLDFNGWQPYEKKNSLYKINLLLDSFTKLRDAMVEEFATSKEDRDDY